MPSLRSRRRKRGDAASDRSLDTMPSDIGVGGSSVTSIDVGGPMGPPVCRTVRRPSSSGIRMKGPRPVEDRPVAPVHGQVAVGTQHERPFGDGFNDVETGLGLRGGQGCSPALTSSSVAITPVARTGSVVSQRLQNGS
jgi:hypothetical protein